MSFMAMMLSLSATPWLVGSNNGGKILAGQSTSSPKLGRWQNGWRFECIGFVSRGRTVVEWQRSVLASNLGACGVPSHWRPSLRARNEEELLSCIRKEVENGRLPSNIAHGLEELYHNYRKALVIDTSALVNATKVLQSGLPEADEIILSNMKVAFDRILIDIENPYLFPPHHKATREPFDYYMFGQNYIRPLVDFRKSYVGNIYLFSDMEQHLLKGHNIILFSNHQTEADPAIIALLLEKTNPEIAESLIFVAGDRVVTDPLCKPFSMGRNLLCVYSKKHLLDDPELADLKKKANTRSLKELSALLKSGSQIIWIAPSGGRDRPDPETGEWFPAPFDASSLDNMRRLAEYSGVPGHFYPLALLCFDVMPPPAQVEKEIGEQRKLSHQGVGLSVATEINFNEVTAQCGNKEEVKETFSMALHYAVTEQYNILKSAICEHQGLEASDSNVSLSQPWTQ